MEDKILDKSLVLEAKKMEVTVFVAYASSMNTVLEAT